MQQQGGSLCGKTEPTTLEVVEVFIYLRKRAINVVGALT